MSKAKGVTQAEEKKDRVAVCMLYLYADLEREHWMRVDGLPNAGEPAPDPQAKEGAERMWYCEPTICKSAQPGQMYHFEMSADYKTIYYVKKGGQRYAGYWNNSEQRAEWRAKQETYAAERALEKARLTDSKDRNSLECLNELRERYHKMANPVRGVFLAQIVTYIVKG